jgi:hypothetical protein
MRPYSVAYYVRPQAWKKLPTHSKIERHEAWKKLPTRFQKKMLYTSSSDKQFALRIRGIEYE